MATKLAEIDAPIRALALLIDPDCWSTPWKTFSNEKLRRQERAIAAARRVDAALSLAGSAVEWIRR